VSFPPRVLYSFPGRLGETGIGLIALQQIEGLVSEGFEVQVYCGSTDRPVPGVSKLVETFKIAGVTIPYYRLLSMPRACGMHDGIVARSLRAGGGVDIVHCWPLGAARTFATARALGARSLLERPNTHTAFAFEVVARELDKLNMRLPRDHPHRQNTRRLAKEEAEYELADFLLCPSDFVARTLRERGIPSAKLVATQYGYDPAKFSVDGKAGKSAGGLSVCFVGRCEPRKGLHYALEAWAASGAGKSGQFLICGKFVPGYRDRMGPVLTDPSVQHLGFTGDVASVMRRCDVMVLPSIEEGSALVTYEARACGCVLMVSDASGARCEHMVDGLVHPVGDVATIREHFAMLSRDRALLERLRAASLAGIGGLTWQAAGKRLAQAYRECLAMPVQAAPVAIK
jgi:glycosyltransferase involved in cell wall biosynthesis